MWRFVLREGAEKFNAAVKTAWGALVDDAERLAQGASKHADLLLQIGRGGRTAALAADLAEAAGTDVDSAELEAAKRKERRGAVNKRALERVTVVLQEVEAGKAAALAAAPAAAGPAPGAKQNRKTRKGQVVQVEQGEHKRTTHSCHSTHKHHQFKQAAQQPKATKVQNLSMPDVCVDSTSAGMGSVVGVLGPHWRGLMVAGGRFLGAIEPSFSQSSMAFSMAGVPSPVCMRVSICFCVGRRAPLYESRMNHVPWRWSSSPPRGSCRRCCASYI